MLKINVIKTDSVVPPRINKIRYVAHKAKAECPIVHPKMIKEIIFNLFNIIYEYFHLNT